MTGGIYPFCLSLTPVSDCEAMDLLHSLTLGDVLRENRRSYPQRDALVCRDDRYTFPQMDERVNRFANALLAEGFGLGDRILWLGQNCHRVLEGLLAAAKVGGVFCPVNWRQTAQELEFVIGDVDARVVIWQDEELGQPVRAARGATRPHAPWPRRGGEGCGACRA